MGRRRFVDTVKQIAFATPSQQPSEGKRQRYPASVPQTWGLQFGDPLWGGGYSFDSALKDAYEVMEVVRFCVDLLADHASSVPWRVSRFSSREAKEFFEYELKSVPNIERHEFFRNFRMRRGIKTLELEPVPHHDLENLVEHPNEWMDRKFFIQVAILHLLMAGNSLTLKLRGVTGDGVGTGPPKEIFPIIPQNIEPKGNSDVFIEYYEHRLPGVSLPVKYPFDDIIHCMFPNPRNLRWGLPVLQSAMRTVSTDKEAVDWNKLSFKNRGVPDLAFTFEKDMNEDRYEMIRQMVRNQFQGNENAKTPVIIGNDAKVNKIGMTAAELDFMVSRQFNARMILMLFGIDPRLAGLDTDAGNQQEIDRRHWNSNIIPLLDRLMGMFNMRLAPEFGDDVLLWPDTARVPAFAEDTHRRTQTAKVLASMGYAPNDLNERFNLGMPPDVEFLDVGVVAASAIRVDLLAAQADAAMQALAEPGGGNPDTAPDGGDPTATPDEDNPDNPFPDPGNPVPPQGVTPFPDQEKLAERLLQVRWTSDEAERWLEDEFFWKNAVLEDDGENEYYGSVSMNAAWSMELHKRANGVDGLRVVDRPEYEVVELRFYHGKRDERRWMNRKAYLARHKPIDFNSMIPNIGVNGHRT